MEDHPDIHLPSPSYWPIILALGMTLIAIGMVSTIFVSLVGIVVLLAAIAGWTWENRVAEQEEIHE
jgi:cytochrome c oxidase subunit 1